MLPAPASPPADAGVAAAFAAHVSARGRSAQQVRAAERFQRRWPTLTAWAAEPLEVRLSTEPNAGPFLLFAMLHGHLHPGYDWLLGSRLTGWWRELEFSPLGGDAAAFVAAAAELGFTERSRTVACSQGLGRLLIQTGHRLGQLTEDDLDEFATACRARVARTGQGWRHYSSSIHAVRQVLFHLGVLDQPPVNLLTRLRQGFQQRLVGVPDRLRPSFVAYLDRLVGTHAAGTVTGTASRLAAFGRHLAAVDPALPSLTDLDRKRHIETYLTALAEARHPRTGAPLSVAERQGRIIAVRSLLDNIAEWGWPEAPRRRLVFRSDLPKLPRPLPRYLTPDVDRRLAAALEGSPNRLAADALLLQRACGLRIGELVDLELDCVHEVPGQGAWLKVPLGKLATERMVPLDEDTVALVDRIVGHRSAGRSIPHPRHGRPVQFLFTHHGRRLSRDAVRDVLTRAGSEAGIDHLTPHALRHTFATALVNAGVSLQSLMALLGHSSAEMSLRYGRLFDATVRAEYERALAQAKAQTGPMPGTRTQLPLAVVTGGADWQDAPAIKARLAGGFCIRAEAQGACPYANICEHCPTFRTDTGYLPVLATQRVDAERLAADAEARGWAGEADRHRRLVARLDTLIRQAETG